MPVECAPEASLTTQWQGRRLVFYLPGMFRLDGMTGKYPALSVTGEECAFGCDHCAGYILRTMLPVLTPVRLLEAARRLSARGSLGMLLSGGCDRDGRLPWERFAETVAHIKRETGLMVSVHAGFPDARQAALLADAGVDQVLVDVIGDDATLGQVYHAPFGVERVRSSLRALRDAGLPVIPHVVCGLHYGRMRGELRALEMIAEIDPSLLVVVALMPLPGTPMQDVTPPSDHDVAGVLVEARRLMPHVPLSLGCARKRGSRSLERLALDIGLDRMALPSPGAVEYARRLGYDVRFQKTCCSIGALPSGVDLSGADWTDAV